MAKVNRSGLEPDLLTETEVCGSHTLPLPRPGTFFDFVHFSSDKKNRIYVVLNFLYLCSVEKC